ncbi:MAG TPA: methyltransferase domain-containing protein [Tepidiformaceae bacterium]
MCNAACVDFVKQWIRPEEVRARDIIEVGSRDVNGSVGPHIGSLSPRGYVGVDIVEGPRVDRLCDVQDLVSVFGAESFDVVVATELLEHVEDWRGAIGNLKTVMRPGGSIFVTTRSVGFPKHDWPGDHWRFSIGDMAQIFADFDIEVIQRDPFDIGVFLKAQKPQEWIPLSLAGYNLYRVV